MNAPFQPGDKVVCIKPCNLVRRLRPISVGTIYCIAGIEETIDARTGKDAWGVTLVGIKMPSDFLYCTSLFRRIWSTDLSVTSSRALTKRDDREPRKD